MRNRYNLSHLAHLAGHIGRLQTISVVPVIPGDSIEFNIDGIFRTAPTRKEIVAECQIDLCAFFVPHRHVYGDIWKEIVSEGLQADDAIPTGPAVAADVRDAFYLGVKTLGANANKALVQGYNRIYQRYFAVPTTTYNGEYDFTNYDFYPGATLNNMRSFGALAARLPHILNGFTLVNVTNAAGYSRSYSDEDWGVEIPQDTPAAGTALLDIRDLKAIQSRYRSVQQQNFFAQYYNDIIQHKWETGPLNTDADPRPTYLGRDTHFVSGHDVNGTDDATLGSYIGKTLDRISFRLPRRYFPEHGNLWIVMLPRFPLVHTKEQHPLLVTAQPDRKLLLGDPAVWAGEPVVPYDPAAWIGSSTFTPDIDVAQQPYGQEYRYQPNRIHPVFEQIPGYPFTSWDDVSGEGWYYYKNNEYFPTFQTSQIHQWQAHLSVAMTKFSTIIDPKNSIFAGA